MKGSTVILIAGWAHGAEAMIPLAEALGEASPVVSTSVSELYAEAQREGKSPGNWGGRSCCARALIERISKIGGPVTLAGWSAGGMVAIEAAAALPQQVAALVLLSTAARFSSEDPLVPGAASAALRAMRGRIGRAPARVLRDFFVNAAAPQMMSEEALRRRVEAALEFGIDCLTDGLDYLRRADLEEAAKRLELPALLVHGAEDRILPWRAGERLASLIPGCSYEIIPNVGHLLIEQCPEFIGRRIREFLVGKP